MDFKDLCSEIDESRKFIKIYLEKRGRRRQTVIVGLPNQSSHLKDFKRRYACNGFLNGDIYLQGDHRNKISEYFKREKIFYHIL